jgi:DMSO/TMAO reductase YedYZ molybdopterin-dependent catalytic subunit
MSVSKSKLRHTTGARNEFKAAPSRRGFLKAAGTAMVTLGATPALAETMIRLPLPDGPYGRQITTDFPQKGALVLQRTRPPLLETPFEVFDQSLFTPNDRFFVRWHWAAIPQEINVASHRITVRGHVNTTLSLSLSDLMTMPRVEMAAVNQCSGNSRGYFQPRVSGGQWSNGAMGNALWTGVPVRDVLDKAGVKAGAVAVRFRGLERPVVEGAPHFLKSLAIDHARDGEVMIAYQMNHEALPILNGFPVRLIVPGWYSTYWLKMLDDIEVLDAPDENFWMAKAYLIPDTPHASVKPGETGFKSVPINHMVPRSFITNVTDKTRVEPGAPVSLRGIAFGGDCGVSQVDLSLDRGETWLGTDLGRDAGKYGFRQWTAQVTAPQSGTLTLDVRCTNEKGEVQPATPNWNGGGFMRNVIERVTLTIA